MLQKNFKFEVEYIHPEIRKILSVSTTLVVDPLQVKFDRGYGAMLRSWWVGMKTSEQFNFVQGSESLPKGGYFRPLILETVKY